MRRTVRTFVALLIVANLLCVAAMGQDHRRYPPFTLVSRFTEYNAKGETIRVSTSTRYQSSNGDWRSVSRSGAGEQATLYRRGKGVYTSFSKTTRIIKMSDHAPGCPLRTGEELARDRKFARMEEVLGFTAYVLIDHLGKDGLVEHYFVPELGGGTPFKQVTTYTNGPKFVSEPISLILAEPDAIDITGPDYLVVEQVPIYLKTIEEHLVSKPDPKIPTDVLGFSGFVNVSVTVDEMGQVISAGAMAGNAPQSLREAAVAAAYRASFNVILVECRAVVAKGIIGYQFASPK